MRVRDIMTTTVITVTPETSVPGIARLLLEHRISAVPVVGADGQIVGIVSEGDLMRRPEIGTESRRSWWLALLTSRDALARDYALARGTRAAEVMSRDVITVTEETPLSALAQLLEEHRIKRAPVVRDGHLVGIVSRADLLRGLATLQGLPSEPGQPDDRTIREAVLAVLRREPWIIPAYISVTVRDGVVHLWGLVKSETERNAVGVAARTVAGVRDVVNHLTV